MAKDKPDPLLCKDQLQALQSVLKTYGVEHFLAVMFWILTKEEKTFTSGEKGILIPYQLNRIQRKLLKNLQQHNLLLKPRQIGGTTFFLLVRLLLPAITEPGTGSVLISQNHEYAALHFGMARRAHRLIGVVDPYNSQLNHFNTALKNNLLHTIASNRREIVLDQLESRLMVASAEVEESGQGVTLQHIVCSEYSRWPGQPEETLSNVRGALIKSGTVDKECTANGAGGAFFEDCMRAMNNPKESDAAFHFYPWWEELDYKIELEPEEAIELEADLKADERAIVKQIHRDLQLVAWTPDEKVPKVYLDRIAFRRKQQLEQRGNFEEKFAEDPLTAFIVSGAQFFDKDLIVARKRELATYQPHAKLRGGNGRIFIPRVANKRYLIGADVASGRTVSSSDTDFNAAVVLALETGEECAALRLRSRPEEFAYDLAELGEYYNFAQIAVERTGDGGTTMLVLATECRYPAVLKYREWIKRERKIIELEGFPTTPKTRPIFLNFLNRMVSAHPEFIWDEEFLNEALTFVRDEKGKPTATNGTHDDTVSARWIAHAARMMVLSYWDPIGAASEKYVNADQITEEELQEVG